MSPLDQKKMKLELHRVESARMDLEIRIEEMKQEITRLEGHVAIQEDKELELKTKLDEKDQGNQ